MLPTPTRGLSLPAVTPSRRWSARLDLAQSASGLALGAFLVLHTVFVSTLLVSPEAFGAIIRLTDLSYFFGRPIHAFHVVVAAVVIVLLVTHALPALRKLPAGHREFQRLRAHLQGMRHVDSSLWYGQVVTGLLLFLLAGVHLYAILTQPDRIGAEFAIERIVEERAWLLYVVLTPIAQFHSVTGLYRLALKWGFVRGENPQHARRKARCVMWAVMTTFIALGLATLSKELHTGLTRRAAAQLEVS